MATEERREHSNLKHMGAPRSIRRLLNKKYPITALCLSIVSLLASACGARSTPALIPTSLFPSPSVTIPAVGSSTMTATLLPRVEIGSQATTETPVPPSTAVPTSTEPAIETYIAYAQDNALFVTHVIGGQSVDTQQITDSQPNEWIMALSWSPSGEFLAYIKYADTFLSWLLDSSIWYFGVFDENIVRSRLCLLTGSTLKGVFMIITCLLVVFRKSK